MKIGFDWKFIGTIFFAVAIGALTPYIQGFYDLQAKSLRVNVVDSIGIDPPSAKLVPGLQLTLNGEVINSPVVTVLELANDGAKPVLTGDFEGPIKLTIENEAKLLEARIGGATPQSLTTGLEFDSKTIQLQPLLLNPKDSIFLTLLTSGEEPKFVAQARIAGVSSIKFERIDNNPKRTKTGWILFMASAWCYVALALVLGAPSVKKLEFTQGTKYLLSLILSVPAGILTGAASTILDPDEKHEWAFLWAPIVVCVVLSFFWRIYYWPKRVIEAPIERSSATPKAGT